MADKQAGGLSLRIGLTLSQLQSDFLAAEQTVKQGIAAINRQQNIIKLRTEADLAGLDAVADKTKIIAVQERSLTQLLDLQRDKLKLATAAYQDVAQSKGANSAAAKQLETSMERERLAVARLEAQLKSLSAQKISPEANIADVSNAIDKLEEKLERLNRSNEIIRIRAQVDMEGLDKTADAEKILEIRQRSLNQQLAIQRDRVRILEAQLNDLAQTQGETAISTQRATLRIERERLALARLEREVREVTASISELNSTNINVNGTTNISSGTGSAGGSGGVGSSGGAGAGGTGAGSSGSWTDLLPFDLPTNKIEAFALAIGAVGAVVGKTVDIINDALSDFRETEKQAYELNIDFNDAEQFLRELKLGGGDIGDFEGFIRGITDAYVKGEYDDPEFIALRKYNAQITDATGRLKNFKDLTDEVYQAWKQADEAGEGIEFLQLVGGEAGVRDAIQFFKRYEEAKEDAAKIADANLDQEQWHELERTINLATEQADEFKEAIANVFTPAAQAAAENFFKLFHDGTEWLIENKDALQRWGYVATELIDDLTEFHPSRLSSKLGETLGKILPDDYDEKLNPDSPASKLLDKLFSSDVFKNEFFYTRAIEKQREFNDAVKDTTESWSDFRKADEAAAKKLADGDPLSQYGWQRLERFKQELEDLKIELDFGDNDYQKSLAELDLWRQRELTDKLQVSAKEREAIEELYAAKSAQIEQEREKNLAEIRKRVAEADQTELEKRLIAIEDEKDKWIKAGMEEAEAEILAEKQKADFIKNIEQELSAEIEAVNQNDLQRKLSQIEKEKQAWIKKGAEEARAEELAQAKRLKAYQETEQKLNEIRNSVLLADRSDLEKRLADIDKEKEAWIQLGMEKAEAEELAQKKREQIIKEANEKVAQDTAKAIDEAARKTEESFERAEQKNEALRNSALNVLKQEAKEFEVFMTEGYNGLQKYLYDQLIKSGVNPEYLKKMTPELLSDYQNATKKAMRSFMPNWEDPYTGKVYKPQIPESSEELKGAQEKATATVRDFSTATNAATGALYNFAEAANYAIVDGKKTTMSEALGTNYAIVDGKKTTMSEALGRLPTATENVTQSFSAMPPVTKAATDALGTLPTAVQGVTENLSGLTMPQYDIPQFETPQLETLNNPFAGMTQDLQVTIQRFTEMNSGVEAVTVKLNNLSAALETLLMQSSNEQTPKETRTPVEVNTTVQIEEAHAWDMNHIQELADKVADIIKPEIISAVGGDSNSY